MQHPALGVPLIAAPLVPEGTALVVDQPSMLFGSEPGPQSRAVLVGIPSRAQTEAALIVRRGLADVLAWLGMPVEPLHLQVAAAHYGLKG